MSSNNANILFLSNLAVEKCTAVYDDHFHVIITHITLVSTSIATSTSSQQNSRFFLHRSSKIIRKNDMAAAVERKKWNKKTLRFAHPYIDFVPHLNMVMCVCGR